LRKDYNNFYSGLGSDNVPGKVLRKISKIALYLANKKYVLRSGRGSKCQIAFEKAIDGINLKQIYLPWNGYKNDQFENSIYNYVTEPALNIARKYSEVWGSLTYLEKAEYGRNAYIILGWRLNKPSKFIVCYFNEEEEVLEHALRIARDYKIPVFNLYNENMFREIFQKLKDVIKNS